MRVISYLLFASLVIIVGSTDKFTRVKREAHSLTEKIVKRHRRQFNTNNRLCSKQCEEALEASIKNNTGIGYNGFDSPFAILNDEFDGAGMEAICTEFERSRSCFDKCDRPCGVMGYYQYLCEHKKGEAKNETSNVCIKQCSNAAFIKALVTTKNAASNTTADVLKLLDALRPRCKFMNCAVDCARQIFDKQCIEDPKAGSFFRELASAGQMTALRDMEALDAELGTKLMPDECMASISPNVCPCPKLDSLVVKSPETPNGTLVSLLNGVVGFSNEVDANNCFTSITCTLPKGLPPTIVFRGVLNHRSVHGRMNQPRAQAIKCDKASGTWMLPPDVNVGKQPFLQFACLSIRMEIAYLFPGAATEAPAQDASRVP